MTRSAEQAGIQAGDLQGMAMANMAVNSFCEISQERGSSVVSTPNASAYPVDQNCFTSLGSMVITAQQVANPFPTVPNLLNAVKLTVTTAQATLGANDLIQWYQPIEGVRVKKLGWGSPLALPLTSARLFRALQNTTIYVCIQDKDSTRSRFKRVFLPANQDVLVSNVFLPDTGGTYPRDKNASIFDLVILGAGSNYQGTPEILNTSGNKKCGADVGNFAATVGNTLYVSGPVMFAGIVPISKETFALINRHVSDEYRLCKRYWRQNPVGFGLGGGTTSWQGYARLEEPMRDTPTASINGSSNQIIFNWIQFATLTSITGIAMNGDDLNFQGTGSGMVDRVMGALVPGALSLNARF
jgi:hypothetical protein